MGDHTQMQEMVGFLRGRYQDAIERVTEPYWRCTDSARGEGWGSRGNDCPLCMHYMFDGTEVATKQAWQDHYEEKHDRTHVLRDIAAKQEILALYYDTVPKDVHVDAWTVMKSVLRSLATEYRDHPDFEHRWL